MGECGIEKLDRENERYPGRRGQCVRRTTNGSYGPCEDFWNPENEIDKEDIYEKGVSR